MTKTELKIKLINDGYEYLPSKFMPNGKIALSFTLPSPVMEKMKKLTLIYGGREALFENLLSTFKVETPKAPNGKFYGRYLTKYCKENSINLKVFKHGDYKFSSVSLDSEIYEKIENISRGYGISKSHVVRLMIEALPEEGWLK